MGETQIYSQRLHGINEKRRILSEVDRVQRELEQQRVKLQQLKRKSLRDRWLMEGLVPTTETDNPLSETENHIKELEVQLESLQEELLYLKNPELRALKGAKVQGVTLQNELVNGERNLQQVDQNENLKAHPITEESDQPHDSQGGEHNISQKDLTSSTKEADGHPVPNNQCNNVSENHEVEHNMDLKLSNEHDDKETHLSQNMESPVLQDADGGYKSLSEGNEIQNSEHSQELQDQKGEHEDRGGNSEDLSLDGEAVDKSHIIPKLGSLEGALEQEDQNLGSPASELGSVSQKTDDLQPSSEKEDLDDDLYKQRNGTESLLDEITKLVNLGEQEVNQQNQDGNKPYSSTEQPSSESLLRDNSEENSQNLEENKVSVSISQEQPSHTPDEAFALSLETERENLVSFNIQEKKSVEVLLEAEAADGLNQGSTLHFEDQNQDSAPLCLENTQSSSLPPGDQEERTTSPCKDQVPSQPLPSRDQNQVDQVQISQVLVVSAPGHEQLSSNSAQGPSTSNQPGTRGTSPAPESQPLLQKPQETDAHHGANTAETRDKSTPTKKKSCQCCVVM